METDVGELQDTASRRKSQCKAGQGRRWQTRTQTSKCLTPFKSVFRNNLQDFQGPANYDGSCWNSLQAALGQQI